MRFVEARYKLLGISSHAAFCRRAKLTPSTWLRIRRGSDAFRFATLDKILDALRCLEDNQQSRVIDKLMPSHPAGTARRRQERGANAIRHP